MTPERDAANEISDSAATETAANDCGCGPGGCLPAPITRRSFLTLSSLSVVGAPLAANGAASADSAGPLAPPPTAADHFVPVNKGLTAARRRQLRAKGRRDIWRGDRRKTVGMPCCGVATGQLYVRGDGTLGYWWIANDGHNTGFGGATSFTTSLGEYGTCYATYTPPAPIIQGFGVVVRPKSGPGVALPLSDSGFDDIGFIGEYPVATLLYDKPRSALPVKIVGEVFSPFIPLNAPDSTLPATILRYRVTNSSRESVSVTVAGWLQNPVFASIKDQMRAISRNAVGDAGGFPALVCDAIAAPPAPKVPVVDELFEDFENGYGAWVKTGECFGDAPAEGTLPGQQNVSGFTGKRLVNTFLRGDATVGTLTSPEFTVRLPYVTFLIGGGSDRERTAFQLLIDDKVVRRASGRDEERLRRGYWDVSEFVGKRARLRIVDTATGGWGHINVDDIHFASAAPTSEEVYSERHPQWGQAALCALDSLGSRVHLSVSDPDSLLNVLKSGETATSGPPVTGPLTKPLLGAVSQSATLKPGETRTFAFALTWYFPNRIQREDDGVGTGARIGLDGPVVGQMYSNRFGSALDVGRYIGKNQSRLIDQTMAFRDCVFETTLPYWLIQRVTMPLSNLATEVVQWWKNGRVWAWEGVGCCTGCCGHVWNYAQGMARLLPEMERSIRVMQDFNPMHGLKPSGAIGFRGTPDYIWAGDAQGGYILKALREHQCSPDNKFLTANWPAVKKALEFLIGQDGPAPDGVLEGVQHNTYDINFFGANTMVGSMYLGALKAGAVMARVMGDAPFAAQCDTLAKRGADESMKRLFNGDYFIQAVDLAAHPRDQYADGCLSDQLLGQWFAHQLGLGHLYPKEAVKKALASVFAYNWAPDVGPQTKAHHPDRDFIKPGEAGLLTCTWPKSRHLGRNSVLYRDEVWSGIEYQVAAHCMAEGLVDEGLAIVRGIHDRYDGARHNPFNEIECGDHYARALASWSCLLALSGFEYDGPSGHIGFAPKMDSSDFKCFFSAAEGWGSVEQSRHGSNVQIKLTLKWGALRLTSLALDASDGAKATVKAGDRELSARVAIRNNRARVTLDKPLVLRAGETLTVRFAGA